MTGSWFTPPMRCRALFACLLVAALQPCSRLGAQSAQTGKADPSRTPSPVENPNAPKAVSGSAITPGEYRVRLQTLDQLVAGCQQAIDASGPGSQAATAACSAEQVGPDVQVAMPEGPRQIRFGWLRELLDSGAKEQAKLQSKPQAKPQAKAPAGPQIPAQAPPQPSKSTAPSKPAAPSDAASDEDSDAEKPADAKKPGAAVKPAPDFPVPTLAAQLADARKRLSEDAQIASQLSAGPAANSTSGSAVQASPQRRLLTQILASKEYNAIQQRRSLRDRLLEKLASWINWIFNALTQAGQRSKWIGYTAEIGFVILLCVALVWLLIRLERHGRLGPASIRPGPGSAAASARDWQLWLEDARKAAARGAWRDAIHFLYWASISRLESGGLWPADRARTPREYLALLSKESAQRPGLTTLTRSFERTWYAGRPAAETDFRQAEQVAAGLGVQVSARLGDEVGAR